MQSITLNVDSNIAQAFLNAPKKQREGLELIISSILAQNLEDKTIPTLKEVMERMGKYAASQGLTEEKLDEILASDD
jgi:molecular chaperone DnaK (HSP70)